MFRRLFEDKNTVRSTAIDLLILYAGVVVVLCTVAYLVCK